MLAVSLASEPGFGQTPEPPMANGGSLKLKPSAAAGPTRLPAVVVVHINQPGVAAARAK